jgi:hypothetical protein
MTKSELRKARKQVKATGQSLTGELAIQPRESTEKSRMRTAKRLARRNRAESRHES